MPSSKFNLNNIKDCFRLAVKNIMKYGDTDIFPYPLETRMFENIEEDIIKSLYDTYQHFEDKLEQAMPLNINCCATVGYTGYRWATQIDPYWNVFFLGLVLYLSNKIEENRLDFNYVYSYRFKPNYNNFSLFSSDIGWKKYQEDSFELCQNSDDIKYVLVCDIADFYPRIYHHRLENALDELDKKDYKFTSSKIKKLLQVFSNTKSYGVPVGCPASRILAELSLNSIDRILKINGVKFKRFVDDYTIFCDSQESAHSVLTLITHKLMENEGLTLQKHKTNIMSKDEFISYTKAKIYGLDKDENSTQVVEFMRLPIRYDPYSSDADKQYEEIKDSLKNFDLLGMLSNEIQKSRINQPLGKQLIKSLIVAEETTLSNAFKIIISNYNELYPIFATIMQVAISCWKRFSKEIKQLLIDSIENLIKNNSFILKTELNLAYASKLLAKENCDQTRILLVEIYSKNNNSIIITNIVTQAMIKWNQRYWLSDLKSKFHTMNSLQRRLFIIASYQLDDEGKHWREHNNKTFTFIEQLYLQWASKRKQENNIEEAL